MKNKKGRMEGVKKWVRDIKWKGWSYKESGRVGKLRMGGKAVM